jgi:hypothetical protein
MILASRYMAMHLTNWGSPNIGGDRFYSPDFESLWLKVVASWIVMGIYTVSLLAPRWIIPKITELTTPLNTQRRNIN